MQPLTADQQKILASAALELSAGCELLNPDLSFREDISDDLAGGAVAWTLRATVHRTVRLSLSRPLVWGVDLVRPHMILTDRLSGLSSRWNVGVYALTTPERRVGERPENYDVSGFDRLHFLQRQVGADYIALAGTTYRQALLDAFTAAGLSGVSIEGSAADDTLPTDRLWPLVGYRAADPDQTNTPVTWLRIINDLLRAIRFRAVWADENGRFICASYQRPEDRAPEFALDADDVLRTIVGEDRTVIRDVWSLPNRWTFRWTNAPTGTATADLVYTYDLPAEHPMSAANRGLVWTSVVDYEAASRAKLVNLGDDRVASDLRITTRFDVPTGPLPAAGHADVMTIRDLAAGINGKAQAVSWEMPLDGGDMRWKFELLT